MTAGRAGSNIGKGKTKVTAKDVNRLLDKGASKRKKVTLKKKGGGR
jgi:hypothetical protein